MAKQMCDLKAGKGISRGQSTEHLRNYKVTDPDMKKYGYYDPTRSRLNFEVGRGGVIMPVRKDYHLDKRFADNLRNRGIEDPNAIKRKKGLPENRNTLAHVMLGGSREQMRRLAFGTQDVDFSNDADNRHVTRADGIEKWAVEMYEFIARKYGEENIVAFVCHLDEKNPHVHCSIVPVNARGKISYNDVFGGPIQVARQKFLALHDEVAGINKKYGLERGTPVKETGARHRTSEEYWLWLRDTCEELENKKEANEQTIAFLEREVRRAEIRVKGLQSMVANLETRQRALLEESGMLEQQLREGKMTLGDVNARREKIAAELQDIEAKILDKQEKLTMAMDMLDKVTLERINIERKINEMKKDISTNLLPVKRERDLMMLAATGFNMAIRDSKYRMPAYREFVDSLEPEQQARFHRVFDGSLLDDIVRRGDEVVVAAALLFGGYLDQATAFAESCGGGGSPGGDWGKKDDEDIEMFKNRCFLMARKMLQPGITKVKKRGMRL